MEHSNTTLVIKDEPFCHRVLIGKTAPENLFYVHVFTEKLGGEGGATFCGCEAINLETALLGLRFDLRIKIRHLLEEGVSEERS